MLGLLRSGCERNGELEARVGKGQEWGAKGRRVSEARPVLLRGLDSLGTLSAPGETQLALGPAAGSFISSQRLEWLCHLFRNPRRVRLWGGRSLWLCSVST